MLQGLKEEGHHFPIKTLFDCISESSPLSPFLLWSSVQPSQLPSCPVLIVGQFGYDLWKAGTP